MIMLLNATLSAYLLLCLTNAPSLDAGTTNAPKATVGSQVVGHSYRYGPFHDAEDARAFAETYQYEESGDIIHATTDGDRVIIRWRDGVAPRPLLWRNHYYQPHSI
jgi:hypothetical protein